MAAAPAPDVTDPTSAIRHRIRAHQAALKIAAEVGLGKDDPGVRDTRLRLDEARACLVAMTVGGSTYGQTITNNR